jgi:hypothetical protein
MFCSAQSVVFYKWKMMGKKRNYAEMYFGSEEKEFLWSSKKV